MAFTSGLITLYSPGPIGLQKCLDGGFCALFDVRLREIGADAEDCDVEEIGFDRFLKLAADYGALNDNPQCCMFDQQGVRVPMPLFQGFVP